MAEGNLSINLWAEDDRPRERLLKFGADKLSDAELLAILIGSGTPQMSAVTLMKQVMSDCHNSLSALGRLTYDQLCRYNGIGQAKAVTIMAACELGRRRQKSATPERHRMDSAAAIYE